MSTDFYDNIQIPLNYEFEENGYEFANAVTVADKFAEATAINAALSRDIEIASKRYSDADFTHVQIKKELAKLRRQIVAENYSKARASMKPELLDAFILTHAGEHKDALILLENQEEEAFKDKIAAESELTRCKHRMWTLERTITYLTEWLNYDKFQHRLYDAAASGR